MPWEVVGVSEFENWFLSLDEASRSRVEDRIDFLEQLGPALGRPVVDLIKTSRHSNMKELRTGTIRILFVFDPASTAVLLLGGDKRATGRAGTRSRFPRPMIFTMPILQKQRTEHGKTIR